MNLFLKLGIAFFIAAVLITFIKPFADEKEENEKYGFNVQTIDGELSKQSFVGSAYAVYFGYTYCPDVCPTTLSSLAHALNNLPDNKTKDFKTLFISVDPDRDTLKNLDEYSKYFHKNFIGATSTKQNLDDIVKRYESHYQKVKLENSAMQYSISHTSYIYLFDKDGKFYKKIDHFSDSNAIKNTLLKIL